MNLKTSYWTNKKHERYSSNALRPVRPSSKVNLRVPRDAFGLFLAPVMFVKIWPTWLVFFDDIHVVSRNSNQPLQRFLYVLEAISASSFTLKPEPCALAYNILKLLGPAFITNEVLPDPRENSAVAYFERPKHKKACKESQCCTPTSRAPQKYLNPF